MKVFRIENKSSHRGPYHHDSDSPEWQEFKFRMKSSHAFFMNMEAHPVPAVEWQSGMWSAFESEDQMHAWFDDDQFSRMINDFNFEVVSRDASEIVFRDDFQVVCK